MTLSVSRFMLSLAMGLILSGCAASAVTTQRAATGTWSYTVFNTPEGDLIGEIVISESAGALIGTLTSPMLEGTSTLQELTFEDEQVTFKANVRFQGQPYSTEVMGALDRDRNHIEGDMQVSGVGTFRFVAMKQAS